MNEVNTRFCIKDTAKGVFNFEVTGTVNGTQYIFQIISAAYTGPGTYNTMSIDIRLSDNQGWVTKTGEVIITGNGGSVNALMAQNLNTSGSVQVTGNFACS
jgi:hypothetical protein